MSILSHRLSWLAIAIFIISPSIASAQMADKKSSPFEALRWDGESPEVMVQSDWYRPLAIQGVDIEEVLSFCKKNYGSKAKKRFGEDLPVALQSMGHPLPANVTLKLQRITDGKVVTLVDVPSTKNNRKAIWRANQTTRAGSENPRGRSNPSRISRQEALADLAAFQKQLDDQFAYRNLRDVDLDAELTRLKSSLGEQVEVEDLTIQLHKLMMSFGDGHARVRSRHMPRPTSHPPFLLEETSKGIVAFMPDRSRFLDPERPYLLAIDGHEIDDLIDVVRPIVPAGSPQLVRSRALREVRTLEMIRELLLEEPAKETVTCMLASGSTDTQPVTYLHPMTSRRPIYGDWPNLKSGIIDSDIGYLRIEEMDDRLIPGIRKSMDEFRDTKGLIVDVRGNGGGTRLPLLVLAGYLLGPDEDPWVGSVARYRTSDRFGRDHLNARYMYRADDPRWSSDQRRVITDLAEGFKPEWDHPEGFSDWHYLVLDQTGSDDEYFYDKPVVILSDANCFSATDIFLGALSGRPRVTLMGGPSGGGSARSQRFELPNSDIEIRCASMASFRPDGRLYDGRGIEVDIEIDPDPTFFLMDGKDNVLEAAVEQIRSN